MHILAIDTAADFCALALASNEKIIAHKYVATQRDQARILAPLCTQLLAENGLKPHDIVRFAITTGPGSFTGLRVGLSFAHGLALATGKPLLGFDHFRCTHEAVSQKNNLLIIRESKRADLFACMYDENGKAQEPFLATAQKLAETLSQNTKLFFTGDGALHIIESLPELSARHLALKNESCVEQAALLAFAANPDNYPAHPLYLREADVSQPKNK